MKKGFIERLENPKSTLTFNIISLSVALLVVVLCILYVISCWGNPDKIYQIIMNILSLFIGLIGGRSLIKNDSN